jgi:predicted XRE-type DNA-binding protein
MADMNFMNSELEYAEEWLPIVGWEGFYEISNLGRVEYVTVSENQLRSYKNGTSKKILGEKSHKEKIRDSEVTEIRRLYLEGFLQKEIAEQFGVCQQLVSLIVRGKHRKFNPEGQEIS